MHFIIKYINLFIFIICVFAVTLNEIELENFRELQISITVRKLTTLPKNYCLTSYIKLSFDNKYKILIKMACMESENFLRADVNVKDYFDNTDIFFRNDLLMKTEMLQKTTKMEIVLFEKTDKLKIHDNSEQIIKAVVNSYEVTLKIIYKCYGYTGYNCEIPNTRSSKYYRHYQTKMPICKKEGDCGDERCYEDSMCNGHGLCYIETFGEEQKYCVCDENYYGKYCEEYFKNPVLAEEVLLFSPKDKLFIKSIESTSCDGCLISKCDIYVSFVVCKETNKYGNITECNNDCNEICGDYICMEIDYDDLKYFYYKSTGEKAKNIRKKFQVGKETKKQNSSSNINLKKPSQNIENGMNGKRKIIITQ